MTDEEYARQLLAAHLAGQGQSGFKCALNRCDPPDLTVSWENGSQWGVEVTRAYLQVADPRATVAQRRARDRSKRPARRPTASGKTSPDTVSSATIIEPLRAFAEQLGEATKNIRKRDYTLSLGPSPVDSLSGEALDFRKQWQVETKKAVIRHIYDNRTCILRRPGVWLRPGDSGSRWTIATNPGVQDIGAAITAMLRRALAEKVADLPGWNGSFVRRWLLLLNRYPLVSNVSEVETAVEQLIRTNADCRGFDGIFWYECADRSLVSIPVSAGRVSSRDGP